MHRNLMLLALLTGGLILSGDFSRGRTGSIGAAEDRDTAKRFAFTPAEITLKKGQPVVLVLKSIDVAHGLRFRDLNVEVKVGAGGTAQVEFTPQKTGDFVGHCFVFCGSGHGSMMLTMHVVD